MSPARINAKNVLQSSPIAVWFRRPSPRREIYRTINLRHAHDKQHPALSLIKPSREDFIYIIRSYQRYRQQYTMRITAELITELVEHRINDLEERELCLGGLGLVALEHLGAARNDFDAYDLSNNRVRRLENFPKVTRLKSLYASNNLVDSLDAINLQQNVPMLQNLVLSYNAVSDFKFLQDLADACPKLEFLSLIGNPISRRPHYRLCALHLLPHVKCMDYVKVKQAERRTAAAWAKSTAGKAILQQSKSEEITAPSFTPGEGVDGQSASSSFVTAHFTTEQKAFIRELLMSAESAQEIEEIENAVRRGVLPSKRARRVIVDEEGG